MSAQIDLSKAHLSRVHGDITAIYSWLNDERALFLIPHLRKGAPWFVVMESAAFTWDDTDPRNVAVVVQKSMKACEVLGIEPTPVNCRRIAGIVIDGLPDLIRMPAKPPAEYHSASFGRMELRADGQAIAGEDIRVEKEGATYA
jgi:hypothetical protein